MIMKLICKLFGHRFKTFIYGNLGGGDYSVVKCCRCGLRLDETEKLLHPGEVRNE